MTLDGLTGLTLRWPHPFRFHPPPDTFRIPFASEPPKINTRTPLSFSLSLSHSTSLSHDFVRILYSASTVFCIPEVFRNAVFLVIYRALYSSPWISNRYARSFPLRSISFCIVIHRLYQMAVASLSLSLSLFLSLSLSRPVPVVSLKRRSSLFPFFFFFLHWFYSHRK